MATKFLKHDAHSKLLVRLMGMSQVEAEINIHLSDGEPPYYLSSWILKKAWTQTPDNGAGWKKRIKGLLPQGFGGLAGKEILRWVGDDGKKQSFRLRKVVIVQLLWKTIWYNLVK